MKRISQMFTVSDGLLPLLDVTLLLLGLFIIILGVVASEVADTDGPSKTTPGTESMTLPSNVVLLRIAQDHTISLSGKEVTQEQLKDRLHNLHANKEKSVVLLQIDNAWDMESNTIFEKCRKEIQDAGLKYTRVF